MNITRVLQLSIAFRIIQQISHSARRAVIPFFIKEKDSGLSNLTTKKTGTLTPNSGVTITNDYIAKYGNIGFLTCIVKVTESKAPYTRLVELPSGYFPSRQAYIGDCDITASGAIRNRESASANQEFVISLTYFIS